MTTDWPVNQQSAISFQLLADLHALTPRRAAES